MPASYQKYALAGAACCVTQQLKCISASPLFANSCSPPAHNSPSKRDTLFFSQWTTCSLCPVTSVYSYTKPNPCLICPPLSLSCYSENAAQLEGSSKTAVLVGQGEITVLLHWSPEGLLVFAPVCLCETGPNLPFTAH